MGPKHQEESHTYEIKDRVALIKGEEGLKMNSKNMHTRLGFLGILLLLGQYSFSMVQGDVHFYDFVVSPSQFPSL
jgi:hypothetical protein